MGRRLSDDELAARLRRRGATGQPLSDDQLAQRLLQRNAETVAKVHDADTLRPDGSPFDVRFLGIDAPETAHKPGDRDQSGGREAADFMASQIGGQKVTYGGKSRDGKGRDVASVYVDGKNVNVEAVRQGHAMVYRDYLGSVAPKMRGELLKAEEEAKAAKRGIWGDPNFEKPEDFRRRRQIEDYQKTGKGPNPLAVSGGDKDEAETGALNRVLDAFDYTANIAKSAAKGAIDAPKGHRLDAALQAAKEGALKTRKTSASDLKDAINRRLGHGKVRFGRDGDGRTTFGDVLDVGSDIALDILIDPLTYATFGASAALRGTKALAQLRALQAAGKTVPAGSKAAKAATAMAAGKAAVGGTLGFGATNADDPIPVRVGAALAGAAAPSLVGRAAAKVAPKLREGMDDAYEWYARKTGRTADAPEEIQAIWAKKKAGKLGEEALERADAQIPTVKTVQEQAARKVQVDELAKKIEADEIAKVEDYVRRTAADQVDKRVKIKDPEVRRQAIDEMAQVIYDTKLTPMRVTEAMRLQKAGLDKIKHISHTIMQGRYRALDGLSDAEKSAATAVMHEGKEYFKGVREELFKAHGFDPEKHLGSGLMERVKTGKLDDEELKHVIQVYNDDFYKWQRARADEIAQQSGHDAATRFLNTTEAKHRTKLNQFDQGYIPREEEKRVFSALKDRGQKIFNEITEVATKRTEAGWEQVALKNQTEKVRQAVVDWTKHNEEVVKKFNDEVLGVTGGVAKDGKGIIGVKWHVDDVYLPQAQEAADELLQVVKQGNVQAARKAGVSDAAERIGADNSYEIYARGLAYKFLDTQTKEAMRIARGYQALVAKQGVVRGWETILKGFDTLTNFSKANMLYFSMSWLKNNYFDNLAKAWIEGGFDNLVDASKLGLLRKELKHDLWQLAGGKFHHATRTQGLDLAFELGVLDGPAFDALVDKETITAAMRADPLYQHFHKVKDQEKAGLLKRVTDTWVKGLSGTVGRVGSYVEGSARFLTFERTRNLLLQLDEFKGQPRQAAELAAELTKKTFFDYGDVSMFEKAVFKRLIPFYSFYSKNLPYWAGAVVDPTRVGRVAAFQSVRDNIGKEATLEDEATLTPHIRRNNPRKVGKDDKGNDLFVISPSSSLDDAISMVGEPLEAMKEKMSPHLKTPYEVVSGHDTFSDNELYPSDSVKGKKFLYSRGFKLVAVQKAAEALGLPEEVLGIKVDARGNPYATKDSVILVDRVFSTLWPQSFVEQVAGSTGKLYHDKEDFLQAFINRLSPAQLTKVSPEMRRMRRQNKERAE